MERRAFLVAITTSLVGVAGCSSGSSGRGERTAATAPSTATRTSISEYDCPPHNRVAEPVVCSHTVDTESANVYLLPSNATVDASADLGLTLYNKSSTKLEFNPYQWSIVRRSPSGWKQIEKQIAGDGRLTLSPGKTHTWTFREIVDFTNETATVDAGTYTAGINVPNPDSSDWLRCLALFRIV